MLWTVTWVVSHLCGSSRQRRCGGGRAGPPAEPAVCGSGQRPVSPGAVLSHQRGPGRRQLPALLPAHTVHTQVCMHTHERGSNQNQPGHHLYHLSLFLSDRVRSVSRPETLCCSSCLCRPPILESPSTLPRTHTSVLWVHTHTYTHTHTHTLINTTLPFTPRRLRSSSVGTSFRVNSCLLNLEMSRIYSASLRDKPIRRVAFCRLCLERPYFE